MYKFQYLGTGILIRVTIYIYIHIPKPFVNFKRYCFNVLILLIHPSIVDCSHKTNIIAQGYISAKRKKFEESHRVLQPTFYTIVVSRKNDFEKCIVKWSEASRNKHSPHPLSIIIRRFIITGCNPVSGAQRNLVLYIY